MRFGRLNMGDTAAVWAEIDREGGAYPWTGAPWENARRTGAMIPSEKVRLLAPAVPSKVVCVGLNYQDHIDEFPRDKVPDNPVIFLKPPTSVIGPGEAIVRPSFSQRVDHEGELAVVIGKRMKDVAPEDALSYVFGYTCLNDVTARDVQRSDGQWTRGKGVDTFCPIGPWIETELDPSSVMLTCMVNGEVRQRSSTSYMIHTIPKLLAFISAAMTLLPGDIVATGTPAGIGPLSAGDVVCVEIEGVGSLQNPVR